MKKCRNVIFQVCKFAKSADLQKYRYANRATVKAGTQECRTERGMEVMWFHTGNYTENAGSLTQSHKVTMQR